MSLIPGTLPSDSCFGTPQEVLELFAQYLDIPAFAVSSKVLYSDTSPLPSTDFIWIDTTGSQNNVLKIYNTVASTYQEYPLTGTAGSPNTLIDGKGTIPAALTSSNQVLVSVTGVLYRATLAQISTGLSITFPTLSNDATASLNVASRVAKAWVIFDGALATSPASATGIRASFNVSSILKNPGLGDYTVNFPAGVFADANYVAVAVSDQSPTRVSNGTAPTATAVRVKVGTVDANYTAVVVFR
jgi:hypothetical protein